MDQPNYLFSDCNVVLSKMYEELYPSQITGILSQLTRVIDHLADKFKVFEMEAVSQAS